MKLIAYQVHPGMMPEIRPAAVTRDWMDATPDKYAYRCLPLNIANAHGWEILCQAGFEAVWDGGGALDSIRIVGAAPAHLLPISHFGAGVLTFHVHALLRTEPGYNLWVGGSPNRIKPGIHPLTGIVETDWAPYSFTMNWKFTRPHFPISFAKGEPFCFLYPVPRGLVEAQQPEIREIDSDPALARDYRAWSEGRQSFLKELPIPDSDAARQVWQKSYFRGNRPDGGAGSADHQTKIMPAEFADRRGTPVE